MNEKEPIEAVFSVNKDDYKALRKKALDMAIIEYGDYVLKAENANVWFRINEYIDFQNRLNKAAYEYIKACRS